jgi:hypothetical protein
MGPEAKPHNLHHDSKSDRARHAFLRAIIGSQASRLSRAEFKTRVRWWKIPSMKQEQADDEEQKEYMRRLPKWRRFRSWWPVHGPKVLFIAFVVAMELAFGLWQMIKYITQTQYRAAFGWGVVMAKTAAGFLYPTFFFLILSMSRYFSTFLRRSYRVSKYINWDLSQDFHIYMFTPSCSRPCTPSATSRARWYLAAAAPRPFSPRRAWRTLRMRTGGSRACDPATPAFRLSP